MMFFAAVAVCLLWFWVALTMVRVALATRILPKTQATEYPTISVIVPARDEEATLLPALQSLLGLDYPQLEIILVNDRSRDSTGDLMESMAAQDGRIRVLHVEQLPEGWLGKNHAVHQASKLAQGQWLLFTDADVHFQPDTLKRAMSLVLERKLDHLVLGPKIQCLTFWEKVFVAFFTTAFCYRYRPDLAAKPGPYYVGIGAFNLVRTAAYRQQGGHTGLAQEVLDDMELGRLMKQRGYRQAFVASGDAVQVRWAFGLSGIIQGLEKNAFAGLGYSLPFALSSCLCVLWGCLAPIWLLTQAHHGPGWGLLGLASMALCGAVHSVALGFPIWAGLTFPLAGLVFCFVILRSAFLCSWRGGIYWRGTFYPIKELRRS